MGPLRRWLPPWQAIGVSPPLYQVLADQLAEEISTMAPGERAPSEHELADRFAVNRLTARAVLDELEQRHLVRRMKGRGTFVARRLPYTISASSPPSWSATVRAAGGVPSFVTDEISVITPTEALSSELQLGGANQRVWLLRRRRFVDGLIAAYTESVLPRDALPGLDRKLADRGSLYDVLEQDYALGPVRSWVRVQLRTAPREVIAKLELRGRPMLHVLTARVEAQGEQRPVEHGTTWFRPDVLDLIIELERQT
jgi:DNA-binding GntR family transcriptional regulator